VLDRSPLPGDDSVTARRAPKRSPTRRGAAVFAALADAACFPRSRHRNRSTTGPSRFAAGRPRLSRARSHVAEPIALAARLDAAAGVLSFRRLAQSGFLPDPHGRRSLRSPGLRSRRRPRSTTIARARCFQGDVRSSPSVARVRPPPEYLSTRSPTSAPRPTACRCPACSTHHATSRAACPSTACRSPRPPLLSASRSTASASATTDALGGRVPDLRLPRLRIAPGVPAIAMAGGVTGNREPWRNPCAHLVAAMGWQRFQHPVRRLELRAPALRSPSRDYRSHARARLNVPLASSCGRAVRRVAAAVGLCFARALFAAHCAMELEPRGLRRRPIPERPPRAMSRCTSSPGRRHAALRSAPLGRRSPMICRNGRFAPPRVNIRRAVPRPATA